MIDVAQDCALGVGVLLTNPLLWVRMCENAA
jgi:hypothetical protein